MKNVINNVTKKKSLTKLLWEEYKENITVALVIIAYIVGVVLLHTFVPGLDYFSYKHKVEVIFNYFLYLFIDLMVLAIGIYILQGIFYIIAFFVAMNRYTYLPITQEEKKASNINSLSEYVKSIEKIGNVEWFIYERYVHIPTTTLNSIANNIKNDYTLEEIENTCLQIHQDYEEYVISNKLYWHYRTILCTIVPSEDFLSIIEKTN